MALEAERSHCLMEATQQQTHAAKARICEGPFRIRLNRDVTLDERKHLATFVVQTKWLGYLDAAGPGDMIE
jgi:hypothetical protein